MHIGIVSHASTYQLREHLVLLGKEPAGRAGATAPNLLVIELLKRGHKVSIFSLTNDLQEGEEYVVQGSNLTIYYGGYRNRIRDSALTLFLKEREFLKRKILEVKPDILHAQWQYEYAWAALQTNIRTIVTCRDSPVRVLILHKTVYRAIRLLMALVVLNRAKNLVATSEYLNRQLRKLVMKKKIHTVPNFEPDWLFKLSSSEPKDISRPKIASINNGFDTRKNMENGIIAFQIFRKRYPLAELHLFGSGYEYDGAAFNWSKTHNYSDNIFFHGSMEFEMVMHELKDLTVLLHPSREETFGNTLAESMAVGTPVVGGKRSGSVPWVVGEDETAGVLVDIEDPMEIASALEKVVSDNLVYSRYCCQARKRAYDLFAADTIVTKYEQLYRDAL